MFSCVISQKNMIYTQSWIFQFYIKANPYFGQSYIGLGVQHAIIILDSKINITKKTYTTFQWEWEFHFDNDSIIHVGSKN